MIVRIVGKLSAISSGMLLLITGALLSTVAVAQKSNRNPAASKDIKFEVISLTPSSQEWQAEAGNTFVPTPDGYRSSLTVGQMIMLAYGPSNPQLWHGVPLVNWPDWIGDPTAWYVLNARVSDTDRDAWRNQSSKHELLRTAMQDLLKDRCKLVIHEKPTQIEVYNLVVQKRGARLTPTPPGSALPQGGPLTSGGRRAFDRLPNHGTRWHYYGATMADLVEFLTLSSSGRPVYDATGITGRYDFTLQDIADPSRDPDEEIYNWPVGPLGLEVKPGNGPGFALVIDHIEKPTPN